MNINKKTLKKLYQQFEYEFNKYVEDNGLQDACVRALFNHVFSDMADAIREDIVKKYSQGDEAMYCYIKDITYNPELPKE